jgi:hypothetical protein
LNEFEYIRFIFSKIDFCEESEFEQYEKNEFDITLRDVPIEYNGESAMEIDLTGAAISEYMEEINYKHSKARFDPPYTYITNIYELHRLLSPAGNTRVFLKIFE